MEIQPSSDTSKISILNIWMNSENLFPNLRFTVENEIGNFHQLRLLKIHC